MFLTAKSSALYIRNNPSTTVKEIVKRYLRLINQDGMIDQDFRVIFEDDCLADSLFMKWPKYATKIMEFAEKTVNWRQQLDISADLMTDEHIHNVALQVLPVLFPTGIQVEKQRKKMKRATQEEALTAFVQFEPMGTNLPTILETKKEYTQPHLLCLGDDRRNLQQTFVIVEENAIPCPSFIKGVDTCFKLTYVMDIHYQWQCSNTWDFLQKVVYELGKGKGRAMSSLSVIELKNYLSPRK
ncbi:uncharacterized protein LOC121431904 [Lytechinus variegatus]|uniref:uncharacterized protein LOC121431904 n=1 Tax=Lytechinus variegatus TaxID=7654 RepID=UPI001BB1471B|nr:uncharacterized protein LOC121431904 [Lytechinus variegatus]